MNDKIRNIIVVILFFTVIIGFMFADLISPDNEISFSERRTLKQSPAISVKRLLNGDFFYEYEKYMLDQFIFRDSFRTLKSIGRYYLMGLKDNNGVYLVGNGVYKMEYPLNEISIIRAAEKFNDIRGKYLDNMNVYYSVIPDKNYFVAKHNGYLHMDYDKLINILYENIKGMTYIDIFQNLKIGDYYRTDIHWKQEEIINIAEKLLTSMNIGKNNNADANLAKTSFTYNELSPFYGAYYGQAALPVKPDILTYLTNDLIDNSTVYDHITGKYFSIYDIDQFGTADSYNLFLSGPQSLLTIENPLCSEERELYIFRDSYGSSLAPLLLEQYSKITLIDIRYIQSTMISEYISFKEGNDVLFIYGTQILNESTMLR